MNSITSGDQREAARANRFHQRFGKKKEYHHVDEDHVEEHSHSNDHGKVETDHTDAGRENRFHQRFGNNREYRHVEEHTLSGVGGTCSVADGSTKEGEEVSMSNDHGLEDGKVQRTAPRKDI